MCGRVIKGRENPRLSGVMGAPETVPLCFTCVIINYVLHMAQDSMNVHRPTKGRQHKTSIYFTCILFLYSADVLFSQSHAILSMSNTPANEFVIVIPSTFHSDYGCSYPLTYQLDTPQSSR